MSKTDYDAIIVPGGGVGADGQLPEWTRRRLDRALTCEGRYYVMLSAGTYHKPLPRDAQGFPVFESVVAGQYLQARGVPEEQILFETASYDTIGNAYFAKVIHTDPLGLKRLKVITSDFHMPRTQAIFEFIFGERFSDREYSLWFDSVSDEGLDQAVIAERRLREARSLQQFQARSAQVENLEQLHRWLFVEHNAYRLTGQREVLDPAVLASY